MPYRNVVEKELYDVSPVHFWRILKKCRQILGVEECARVIGDEDRIIRRASLSVEAAMRKLCDVK